MSTASLAWRRRTAKIHPPQSLRAVQKFYRMLSKEVTRPISFFPFKNTYLRCSGQALQGVKALSEAVQKLRQSPESLTSVHSDYLQLCLVAKIFKVRPRL